MDRFTHLPIHADDQRYRQAIHWLAINRVKFKSENKIVIFRSVRAEMAFYRAMYYPYYSSDLVARTMFESWSHEYWEELTRDVERVRGRKLIYYFVLLLHEHY